VRELGARSVALGKPVVAMKTGRGLGGRRAAASHSGTLTGSEEAFAALAASSGLIVEDDWENLLELAAHLAKPTSIRPISKVGIITTSGGAGVVIADAADRLGFELPSPSASTHEALSAVLPAYAATGNPVDLTASTVGATGSYRAALAAVTADANFDAVIVALTTALDPWSDERDAGITAAATGADKPVCAVCSPASKKRMPPSAWCRVPPSRCSGRRPDAFGPWPPAITGRSWSTDQRPPATRPRAHPTNPKMAWSVRSSRRAGARKPVSRWWRRRSSRRRPTPCRRRRGWGFPSA